MEPINKKKYAIILAALAIASAIVFVFYSHKYNWGYTILPMVFLIVAFWFLVSVFVPRSWTNKIPLLVRRVIYVFLFSGLVALLSAWRGSYQQGQLDRYGVVVDGKVIDSHSGQAIFYIEIEYNYDKTEYRQRLSDSSNVYKYHDELKVLCSSRDPEIFRIVGHKSALDIKY